MFPEPKAEKPASTALSIFIAVLVLLLITGGISWFYFNSKASTPEPVATTTTPTTTEPTSDTVETESTITTAPTDIASAISQLDKELVVIGLDQNSDDDTIDL